MIGNSFCCNVWRGILVLLASLSLTVSAGAQSAASKPVIGSQNTVTADPPVPRPHTKPCVVQLFSNQEFADFNLKPFTFTPPAECPGAWAKVVFVGDFSVSAGVQFDRTAEITIGNTVIFYGTTPEPSPTFGPSWHVESDLTDYSALLRTPQSGDANIGNLVDSTYTGIISGTAELEFYPANFSNPAPRTPDAVLSVSNNAGGAVSLASTTSVLTQTFTLPTNIERLYLDVYSQSQSNDEFWYTCVPNDVANELFSCGGTGFRETEITIDGQPAGVAPVSPWIYTGGLSDPYLWFPLPGVQTLNFVPYRVDLTPFAGTLNDGQPHTVGVSVFNADNYFNVAAALLLYLDRGSEQVTGAVTANTIGAGPNPAVVENITTDASGDITGSVTVTSTRQFTLAGYVNTSHGRVETKVVENVNFRNAQQFVINASTYVQDIKQATDVTSTTITRDGFAAIETERHFSFPLTVDFSEPVNADGSFSFIPVIRQQYQNDEAERVNNRALFFSTLSNIVASTDTLLFDASGGFLGHQGQKSSQNYSYANSLGACYSKDLKAANNVLTGINGGFGCR